MKALLLCPLLLAASIAAAESPIEWIHAGTLIQDPREAPLTNHYIGVRDGAIVEITDRAPSDPITIDWSQRVVLPGLIDCHVHLASDRGGVDGVIAGVTQNPPAIAYETLINAHKTLAAGFTTVRNLGDGSGATLALRDAINAGRLIGPRILDAGRSISVTAGHMDPRLSFADHLQDAIYRGENLCDGADDCRRAVRKQIARGVDWIKIATTGGVNSRVGAGLGQQMFEDEARAIVETAHLAGKKVAVHAHGADGIALALKVGADSIEHGTLLDQATIAQMKRDGVALVATMSTVNGYKARLAANPDAYDAVVKPKVLWRIGITGKAFREAVSGGVPIAFGTDAGVSLHGRNADEFALMVEHGLTPAQAITAATVNGAKLLGLSEQIGTLEVGKRADLIAVDGNPLRDVTVLTRVVAVVKDGVLVHSPERPLK